MSLPPRWSTCLCSPKDRLKIKALSRDIERRISATLAPINESTAPKETRPLINAVNRLIAYFEDRSIHEQDFSANASHELRTPLAGIRIQTEIAMSTDDPEIRQKSHQNVLKAIDQSERLIEQLLVMARLATNRIELTMENIHLDQLCEHVIINLIDLAEEKLISLKHEIPNNLTILGNEESISILLHNLIRNAIYYSPEGGKIRIRAATLQNNKVLLSVIDNGPGISADKYDLVLRRFQKTNNNESSGSGLGLAIVKRICDLHYATLTLDQPPPPNGLKISITFNH